MIVVSFLPKLCSLMQAIRAVYMSSFNSVRQYTCGACLITRLTTASITSRISA
nr:MAG TPA: hypothetical protein [Caudoviricetes sp.]